MLRTRLWMGAILIALAVGALAFDRRLAPIHPFLLMLILGLGLAACRELLHLLGPQRQLPGWLCYAAVVTLTATNWLTHLLGASSPWPALSLVFALIVLAAFLVEMARFREPGESVVRIALVVWIVAYVGWLPCFLAQLHWLPDLGEAGNRGVVALAMTIFVPKMGDTGAYFTGRLLGKHKMSPILSPKKTWEGAAGGMVAAVVAAVAINRLGPALNGGLLAEIGFGFSVGLIGLLGDLAESLIKRDCQQKDASAIMPGFGGVLDVVDAILFAAPVAYLWFQL